jgi:hypothetical protein
MRCVLGFRLKQYECECECVVLLRFESPKAELRDHVQDSSQGVPDHEGYSAFSLPCPLVSANLGE